MPVISTNLAANSAVRYLNINSASQTSSLSKLASGSRITQASDDAAGLAISTKISSDVTALNQAATNASHGISVLQTADGGASNISDILQRMKALASQASSGTVTNNERAYIDAEFQQLIDEVDAISVGTRYNGQSLLDGSSAFADAGISVMVGSDADDIITVTLDTLNALGLGLTSTAPEAAPADVVAAGTAVTTVDTTAGDMSFTVNDVKVTLSSAGGGTTAGEWTAAEIVTAINAALTDAGSDVSVANAAGVFTFSNTATGQGAYITVGGFKNMAATDLGFAAGDVLTETGTGGDLTVATQASAKATLGVLDDAISTTSKARANIGSLESRFGFHQASIATSVENLTAAISAIRDTDVASEAAKLASAKVKTQAAVASAAQASQMPQELLKLLQ